MTHSSKLLLLVTASLGLLGATACNSKKTPNPCESCTAPGMTCDASTQSKCVPICDSCTAAGMTCDASTAYTCVSMCASCTAVGMKCDDSTQYQCLRICDLCTDTQMCKNNQCVARPDPSVCNGCVAPKKCDLSTLFECKPICEFCSADQVCINDQCVAKVAGGYGTSCEEEPDACAQGYTCVGGPYFLDRADYQVLSTHRIPDPTRPDGSTKPAFDFNPDMTPVQVLARTYAASDASGAYCAKTGCASDADCPYQTYCITANTINDTQTADDKQVKVCVHREAFAPARWVSECFPASNRGFAQENGQGYCTMNCVTNGDCGGGNETICVNGLCAPQTTSVVDNTPSTCNNTYTPAASCAKCSKDSDCPTAGQFCSRDNVSNPGHCVTRTSSFVPTGQPFSSCIQDSDCGAGGTCTYNGLTGSYHCTTPCTCAGILYVTDSYGNPIDPKATTNDFFQTDDGTQAYADAQCMGAPGTGCPTYTPGGFRTRCTVGVVLDLTQTPRVVTKWGTGSCDISPYWPGGNESGAVYPFCFNDADCTAPALCDPIIGKCATKGCTQDYNCPWDYKCDKTGAKICIPK